MGHDKRNVPLTVPRLSPFIAPYVGVVLFLVLQTSLFAHEAPNVRCGFIENFTRIDSRGNLIAGQTRPSLPFSLESSSGHVRVHYTTSGVDAVPATDDDGTGIPDYVEEAVRSLEIAWDYETGTLGYLPPPSDSLSGGSAAIDVYLLDLSKAGPTGNGWYGITNFDEQIAFGTLERYTSWIEVDNDFSPDDRNVHGQRVFVTTGIDGLRVTTAHELHHTIQVGAYGVSRVPPLQPMLYEMTSTWMELAVWPALRDWATYMAQLLKNPEFFPFSAPGAGNGYPWGWYGAVLHSYEGKHILRTTWEHIALGERPFQALDNACDAEGVPLEQMFCDALRVLYRTGSRGKTNPILPFADSLPEINLYVDQSVKVPSDVVSGILKPYDVRAMRFSVPSVVDPNLPLSVTILLTWPNTSAMILSDLNSVTPFTVTLTASPSGSDTPLNGSSWGVRVSPAEICFQIEGVQTERTESPYPLPIVYGTQQILSVPLPSALPGDVATVTLLIPSMVAIRSDTAPVVLDDTRIVVNWNVPSSLRPGIYLLNVDCAGTTALHKIVVR